MIPTLTTLLAQADVAAPAAPGGGGLGMLAPMLIIMVMFYFILIRPQRQQQKRQEQMRQGARVGDKVVTIGGIHGMISGITDKTVSVKVADGLSIKFDRSAIASVVDSKPSKDEAPARIETGDTNEIKA